jgi:hypothetical protein
LVALPVQNKRHRICQRNWDKVDEQQHRTTMQPGPTSTSPGKKLEAASALASANGRRGAGTAKTLSSSSFLRPAAGAAPPTANGSIWA